MPAETLADIISKLFDGLQEKKLDAAGAQADRVMADFGDRFDFPEVSVEKRQLLCASLVECLSTESWPSATIKLARLFRLLSREPNHIEQLAGQELLDVILHKADYQQATSDDSYGVVCTELHKALCNCAFHSSTVRSIITKKGHIYDRLLQGFRIYAQSECPMIVHRRNTLHWRQMFSSVRETAQPSAQFEHDRRFDRSLFDVKLFFIITAKTADMRKGLHSSCSAAEHLTCMLEQHLQRPDTSNQDRKLLLSKEDADLLQEVFKSLFNVLVDTDWRRTSLIEEGDAQLCKRLLLCGRRVLSMTVPAIPASNADTWLGLCSHVVNIFTLLPSTVLKQLGDPQLDICDRRPVMFHDLNMAPVASIIQVLDKQLALTSDGSGCGRETLVPVLFVLTSLAQLDYKYRKYLRFRLLPPLRDEVLNRPDYGNSYRNRLVRLMTDVTVASQAVAELLFELCKRNVGRLIKYTGYGNAAGLLANHGLLAGGGHADSGRDSEDSDTEEYEALKSRVNPVTGFVDNVDTQSAMAGMSDEQKEYEAMKLVEHMDKLLNQGVISPGVIGEDGRPQAARHVLQLRKQVHDAPEDEEGGDD